MPARMPPGLTGYTGEHVCFRLDGAVAPNTAKVEAWLLALDREGMPLALTVDAGGVAMSQLPMFGATAIRKRASKKLTAIGGPPSAVDHAALLERRQAGDVAIDLRARHRPILARRSFFHPVHLFCCAHH